MAFISCALKSLEPCLAQLESSGKQRNEASAEAQKLITDGVSEIEKLTQNIADSRTFLIYPKKAILLSKIEAVKQEIAKCKKDGILNSDFLGDMERTLNTKLSID